MTSDQYAQFQTIQCELVKLTDFFVPIETVDGNQLFQLLSDAAFEFFKKNGEAAT